MKAMTRAFAAVLLSAGVLWAAETGSGPAEHPLYQQIFKAAADSGKPALIVYSEPTTCPLANGARDFMLVRSLAGLRARYVVAEAPINNADRRYSAYRQKFPGMMIPFWVIVTPDGEFIDGGDYDTIGSGGEKGWLARVQRVAASRPPIPPRQVAAAQAAIEQARGDIGAEEFARAIATLEKLRGMWYPRQTVNEYDKLCKELLDIGQKRLADAEQLAGKDDILAAALLYDKTVRQFGTRVPVGQQAGKKLTELLTAHRDIRPQFETARRNVQAEELMARGAALDQPETLRQARVPYLTVVQRFADTPSAAPAREALARIDAALSKPGAQAEDGASAPAPGAAGPAAQAGPTTRPDAAATADPERAAEGLIELARSFRASRMDEQALAKLEECIKLYPDTQAARTAADLLKEWRAYPFSR